MDPPSHNDASDNSLKKQNTDFLVDRTGTSYVPKQYTINYNTYLQYLSTCSNSGGVESVYIVTEQESKYEKPDIHMTHWKLLGGRM